MENKMDMKKFYNYPQDLMRACKRLADSIKKMFPDIDACCNDCLYFKHKSWIGKGESKDRIGKCELSIRKKQSYYKKYNDELEWRITTDKKVKDWINSGEVQAMNNFCSGFRCFVYRRYKKIPILKHRWYYLKKIIINKLNF